MGNQLKLGFDLLVDGHCLHCIVLDDRKTFLQEAMRVLRPGGMLVVNTMSMEAPEAKVAEMEGNFDPATRTHSYKGVAVRHYGTPNSLLTEIKGAGFHIAKHWLVPDKDVEHFSDLLVAAFRPGE